MPAEVKQIENCLFLSCQIPETFDPIDARENYLINKITENEIHIEVGSEKLVFEIGK